MSEIPAFPITDNGHSIYAGMSLRDYFAANAISSVPIILEITSKSIDDASIAKRAYALADAMMKARER